MQATAEIVGSAIVLNGLKWWTSGVGDPRCKFVIFMGVSDPELSLLMAMARTLRIADGPDEVPRRLVARMEVKKYL